MNINQKIILSGLAIILLLSSCNKQNDLLQQIKNTVNNPSPSDNDSIAVNDSTTIDTLYTRQSLLGKWEVVSASVIVEIGTNNIRQGDTDSVDCTIEFYNNGTFNSIVNHSSTIHGQFSSSFNNPAGGAYGTLTLTNGIDFQTGTFVTSNYGQVFYELGITTTSQFNIFNNNGELTIECFTPSTGQYKTEGIKQSNVIHLVRVS